MGAAGVSRAALRPKPKITRPEVLDTLRRLHAAGRKVSLKAMLGSQPALVTAAKREFGGAWSAALRAAGLDPERERHRPRRTAAMARQCVRDRRQTVAAARRWVHTAAAGQQLTRADVPNSLVRAVRRELNLTWGEFLRREGHPAARTRTTWTRATVTAALRSRRRARLPMNATAVAREQHGLFRAAVRRFGSWTAALRHIGIDPATVRRCQPWSKARLFAGIRSRLAAGQPLDATTVRREAGALVRMARDRFGWTWRQALAAAGVDPGPHTRSNRKWTLDTATAWIRRRGASGRPLATRDAPWGLVAFVHRTLNRSWPEFVRSLGVRHALAYEPVDWTRAEVLRRIRARHAAGQALWSSVVHQEDGRLRTHAMRLFGSWHGALRAGRVPIPPPKPRTRRRVGAKSSR